MNPLEEFEEPESDLDKDAFAFLGINLVCFVFLFSLINLEISSFEYSSTCFQFSSVM